MSDEKTPWTLRWVIRKILSRLARYTPGVFYYSADMPASINGVLREVKLSDERGRTELGVASLSMSCAAAEMLPQVGDRAVIHMEAVSNRGDNLGHWRVTVEHTDGSKETNNDK